MKRCSLFCAGIWPFILLPLLVLLPLLFFKWHPIEADVANNTRQDLDSIGQGWAKVETRNLGRDVLITGTPPNNAAVDAVRLKAEQSYGVNSVTISTDVQAPLTAAELNASIAGSSIELSGKLANQSAIDRVVAQAKTAFGENNVTNKLQSGDSVAKLPNLLGYFKALSNKTNKLNTLTASLNGTELSLKGSVANAEAINLLDEKMSQELALNVDNQLRVISLPVKKFNCSEQINNLLSNSRINFASGKAAIEQSSFPLLESIKAVALRCPNTRFEVSGHTDSKGNVNFNKRLSEQRAQAVISHLNGLGLDIQNFTAVGYGPEQAIADNATAEGRAKNRRIEFKLKN